MSTAFVIIRSIINIALGVTQRAFGIQALPVFILCYHGIGKTKYVHDVSKETFIKHMEYLKKTCIFVSLDEIALHLQGGARWTKPAVAITFDDGYKSILQIRSIIKRFGIQPTVFLLSHPTNANRTELENSHMLLSESETRTLLADGWKIGSHSATHVNLQNVALPIKQQEILTSKKTLERIFGRRVHWFAYPKGSYDIASMQLVKQAGYTHAFSMNDTTIDVRTDPFSIGRIGINQTHSIAEFKTLFTPWVQKTRAILKKGFLHA
jgi:peptidoglycan/xylan/chitin deacetylase (PgdA/CDA1 family)